MWVATTDQASLPVANDLAKVEPLAERGREPAQATARPGDDYQIGAAEALLISNGNKLDELLGDSGDRLVGRLAKITDRREKIEVAVRNVLSRPADEEEIALLEHFLESRADRPVEAARHLVWALLAGGEFRFNH
jgi:hypothetical protein